MRGSVDSNLAILEGLSPLTSFVLGLPGLPFDLGGEIVIWGGASKSEEVDGRLVEIDEDALRVVREGPLDKGTEDVVGAGSKT